MNSLELVVEWQKKLEQNPNSSELRQLLQDTLFLAGTNMCVAWCQAKQAPRYKDVIVAWIEAVRYFRTAPSIFKPNKRLLARLLYQIAFAYEQMGDLETAADYFRQGLDVDKQIDSKLILLLHCKPPLVEALYFFHALNSINPSNVSQPAIKVLQTMHDQAKLQDSLDKEKSFWQNLYSALRDDHKPLSFAVVCLFNFGLMQLKSGNITRALEIFDRALKMQERLCINGYEELAILCKNAISAHNQTEHLDKLVWFHFRRDIEHPKEDFLSILTEEDDLRMDADEDENNKTDGKRKVTSYSSR